MRSGRHGAARPPIGVLIQQDRVDFSLFVLIIVIALAVMALTGWASAAFWLAFLPIFASGALIVRRIEKLGRDEVREEEFHR